MPRAAETSGPSFVEQLRRNAVALISLVVALTALGYNTWRNEQTELNRNLRHAGFEVLLKLGELQRVAFDLRYDRERMAGTPRVGWSYVLEIEDLSMLLPEPMPANARRLKRVWQDNWQGLESRDSTKADLAYEPISDSIDATRVEIVNTLTSLK
ncbi:MAG TPA: hypothetical protein VM616_01855 [Gammaproteobacteria bacterium]|nr:hypothetical protein [Gammaproteobacteria bacterium]